MASLDLKDLKNLKLDFGKIGDVLSLLGPATSVGLSIGTSSIKLVELKKSGKNWKLLHFGIVQLPEDAIVNREIVNAIAVAEGLQTLTSQIKLKSKSVCTSLSGTAVIIKRMSVDVPKKSELQDHVFWEAEQYIPFDISEVVMDYHVLSRGKDSRTDLVLAAAKRSVLDSYMAVVEDGGLRPRIVDTDYFALQTMYEANYPSSQGEAVAVVDIGAAALKLVVVHAGVPVFTKDSALGGRNLTAEIQKHLNLSFADAEALKTGGGAAAPLPQEVLDLMNIMSENFATEVKRALDFYAASSSGAPVSSVLLAGGSARIPGLPKTIESITGLPSQVVNPFNAISYDPAVFNPEAIEAVSSQLAVAVGLALRAGSK